MRTLIAVTGRARWEDDPEAGALTPGEVGGYRAAARRQRLVIEADDEPVRASDDRRAFD